MNPNLLVESVNISGFVEKSSVACLWDGGGGRNAGFFFWIKDLSWASNFVAVEDSWGCLSMHVILRLSVYVRWRERWPRPEPMS